MPNEDEHKTRGVQSSKSTEKTINSGTAETIEGQTPEQTLIEKIELKPMELEFPQYVAKIPQFEAKIILPKYELPKPLQVYHGPISKPQITTPSGCFMPRPRSDGLARWWSSGYNFIAPKDTPGICSLKVVNGTDRDAVVKMVSEKQNDKTPAGVLCRFVYICAGKTVTIQGIGEGDYRLFFCTGTHWHRTKKSFLRPYAAQKFVEIMNFSQQHLVGSIQYSSNEVSLHPVVGGSARTTGVDQEEFDRLL